jgi:hypothetical protein
LILVPWIWSAVEFVRADDPDTRADALLSLWPLWLLIAALVAVFELRNGVTFSRLLPFVVLAAVHGTFMSQQLWGSTYALWPLLILLIAWVIALLPTGPRRFMMTAGIGAVLLGCGGVYSASLERLSYIDIPDGPIEYAQTPALRDMASPGQYLANLDELVRFTDVEIPHEDAILLLPGEDPFYYATGRTPQFPVTLFDPATDPLGPHELMNEAARRGVRWVIVKRVLQSKENVMPGFEEAMRAIQSEFALHRQLAGYDVYRRK